MRKILALCMFAMIGSEALAAPAMLYTCVGKDKKTEAAVSFDVIFADYARGEGYTNQAITILRRGYETLENPIVLQMYQATQKNECQRNYANEIFLLGEHFEMIPTAEGELAPYKMIVKSACADAELDLEGYCFFQN